jgi:hypothetical protein
MLERARLVSGTDEDMIVVCKDDTSKEAHIQQALQQLRQQTNTGKNTRNDD